MDSSIFHGNTVSSKRILYTPSSFARANLLHLQEIGTLTARKPHTSQRENLASFLFFLVEEGEGELSYNGRIWPMRAGDCAFIDCHRPYSHSTSENLWSLRWAHFFGPNINGIYEKYTERGGLPCFHPSSLSAYQSLLDALYETAASSGYVKDMEIYAKLASLTALLMGESWNPPERTRRSTRRYNLQSVKDYIDEHYSEKISLDMLSENFFINKFYLTRIFKEQFGLSVNGYLQQVRITHAKQLLRFSDLPAETVGQECGMSDPSYFSRMFRKIEGISPLEYRKRW